MAPCGPLYSPKGDLATQALTLAESLRCSVEFGFQSDSDRKIESRPSQLGNIGIKRQYNLNPQAAIGRIRGANRSRMFLNCSFRDSESEPGAM